MILFLSLLGRANADVGELRYDVTNLTISDNGNITFKGWAFLHKTQNFVTVNKMNNDGKETNEILNITLSDNTTTKNGQHKIFINASMSVFLVIAFSLFAEYAILIYGSRRQQIASAIVINIPKIGW